MYHLLSQSPSWSPCVACARNVRGQESTATRSKKPTIDFRAVKRDYRTVTKGKWSFEVEQQLIDEAPAIAAGAVARLELNLNMIFRLIPPATRKPLTEIKLFVLYGSKSRGGGYDNGLQYCSENAPKNHQNLDERWSRCVLIHCAENYAKLDDIWALKALLHEYGHARHLENWPKKEPELKTAWENAVNSGLYKNMRDYKGEFVQDAYARENELEYIAELSVMYFAKNVYAPFDRAALKKYDPAGYAIVQKVWGLGKPATATKAEKKTAAQTTPSEKGK